MLPKSVRSTESVALSGGEVALRGLTWDEVRQLKGDRANPLAIAFGTGCTEEEAAAWIEDPDTVAGDVQALLDAVMAASGLGEGAQKS